MAQYHKIPQNVTTYQGRIIGKFTAKQFIFLAVGAMAIFLIVNSPLSKPIKIGVSGGIGLISLTLALANVDGRSTDFWISTFLHVAYIPTQRIWRKKPHPPKYLLPNYHPPKRKLGPRKRTTTELNELINIWQPIASETQDLTDSEKERLAKIRELTSSQKKFDLKSEQILKNTQEKNMPEVANIKQENNDISTQPNHTQISVKENPERSNKDEHK